MMNQEKYLKGAIEIGDHLLEKAHKSDDGYSWETMTLGEGGKGEWIVSESLYSGVAGIVYFFLELHKQTNDPKYLDAVVQGSRWLEKHCEETSTSYYAFYTGRMGVSYLMLVLADYFKDDSYKDKALRIAENCETFLEGERQIDDLINGSSGTILGLLHLHVATGNPDLLKKIEHFTDHLISRANFGKQGLYWDRSSTNITGLCGFSHGASGIGYVFLELGHYFKNETFYWIAEQAFAYENHLYDSESCNWPDFRRGVYDEKSLKEHREEYIKGNKEFFFKPNDMSAWCHGAPGIGLSRVRAYELLKKEQYLKDLKNAINKTMKVSVGPEASDITYVLCHGGGGNAILLLEAERSLKGNDYVKSVMMVADRALNYKENNDIYISGYAGLKGDTSLFMGDAGIGYFYLLLAAGGLSAPSILKPDVMSVYNGVEKGVLDMNSDQLYDKLVSKLFPSTFEYIKSKGIEMGKKVLEVDIMASVTARIKSIVESTADPVLSEIWKYETMKIELDKALESHSYNYIQRVVETEKNKAILENKTALLQATVTLPEGSVLAIAPGAVVDESDGAEENYMILMPTSDRLLEFPLNYFSYAVIQKFEQPKQIEAVINEMVDEFEVSNESEAEQVRAATLSQIEEAMKQGILLLSNSAVLDEK